MNRDEVVEYIKEVETFLSNIDAPYDSHWNVSKILAHDYINAIKNGLVDKDQDRVNTNMKQLQTIIDEFLTQINKQK